MSVVMVVAPIVSASWPILSTAALSAASSLGFTMMKKEYDDRPQPKESESVDLEIEHSEVFKESLQDEKQLVFHKDDVTLTFYADEHGKCKLHVSGSKQSKRQLQQIGTEMMNRITQQYVYNKVVSELKKKGYSVASEEMLANKTVCVVVRRFA